MSAFLTASHLVVDESAGTATFTVKLSGTPEGSVSVNYSFGQGTASSYSDYSAQSGTLRFAPGTTTQTVRFELNSAVGQEPLESFYMKLSTPVNASIANDVTWATIVDDDRVVTDGNASGTFEAAEKANLSVRDVVVDEKAGTATFYLMLNKATTEAFSVAYSTAMVAGTATAGADFTAASGSIGFAAGQTSQSVTVSILDDTAAESNEYFHLALGALSGSATNQVQVADGVGTALIGRNDQAALASPVISASPIVVSEGDGYAEFVVQLSAPGANPVSVNYSFGQGTASSYSDYSAQSGTLRFAPGTTTQTVGVSITDDLVAEQNESFYLKLAAPSSSDVVLGNATANATILDNDGGSPGTLVTWNDRYDLGAMLDMAALSEAAYSEGRTLRNTLVELGWKPLEDSPGLDVDEGGCFTVPSTDPDAYLLHGDGTAYALAATRYRGEERDLVIAFRGTDDDMVSTNFAQDGFARYYQDLRPLVAHALDQAVAAKVDHIYITGHSLGGAAVQAALLDILEPQDISIFEGGSGTPLLASDRLTNVHPGLSEADLEYIRQHLVSATFGAPWVAEGPATDLNPVVESDLAEYKSLLFQFEHIESLALSLVTNDPVAEFDPELGSRVIIDLSDDTVERYASIENGLFMPVLHPMGSYQESTLRAVFNLPLIETSHLGTLHGWPTLFPATQGTAGNDLLVARGAPLSGGPGNDVFVAARSASTFDGGVGNDVFVVGQLNSSVSIVDGSGADFDRLYFGPGITFGNFSSIEVLGKSLVFTARNGGSVKIQDWTLGNQRPIAEVGLLVGDHDVIDGAAEYLDLTRFSVGEGGTGGLLHSNDFLVGDAAADTLNGGGGLDLLAAGGGNDSLLGLSGNDTLFGGAGNDSLIGGAGIDSMIGGDGNDTYVVGSGDVLSETGTTAAAGTADLVQSSITWSLAAGAGQAAIERLTLTGTTAINGTGNNLANLIIGNTAANSLSGGSGNDTLDGGSGNDTLTGSTGNDSLIGGAGIDSMLGGDGNDTYVVGSGDLLSETGTVSSTADLVQSSITWSIAGAGQTAIERLTLTGAGAINGTGNTLANSLTGNTAANILNGGAGADTMLGGAGNDTYAVDSLGDKVYETTSAAGTTNAGGTDKVISFVTFNLAEYAGVSFVENLTLIGTDAINGTGNALANTIVGNSAANVLRGLNGNDVIVGGSGADILHGGANNDLLRGGAGNDILYGGADNDTFLFDTALSTSTVSNLDQIKDFNPVQDTIQLENSIFTKLSATGAINPAFFSANTSGLAQDSNDYIIHETDTGKLFYDANGSAAGGSVQIALLLSNPALTSADFMLI